MLDFIRRVLANEPARFVGYGSALAVFAALRVAAYFGVTDWMTLDIQSFISLAAGGVIAELIRRFVFAPATVQAIANEATNLPPGSVADIGKPPDASPPLPEGEG